MRADPHDHVARSMLADALEEMGETDLARAHRYIVSRGHSTDPWQLSPYPHPQTGGSYGLSQSMMPGHLYEHLSQPHMEGTGGWWRTYDTDHDAYLDLGKAVAAYEQAQRLATPPQPPTQDPQPRRASA